MKAAAEPLMRQLKEAGEPGKADPRTALRTLSTRYFEPAIHVIAGTARQLAALPPPAATRTDFRELLHLSTVAIEINEAQARALDLGSMKAGRSVEPQLQSTARRIRRLAHRIGIDSCGDGAAFGPSDSNPQKGAHEESAA